MLALKIHLHELSPVQNGMAESRPAAPAAGQRSTPSALAAAAGRAVDELAAFVAIGEASALLGMDEGALRRKCRDTLLQQGLALRLTPPDGGPEKWYIRREHDRRLLGGGIGGLYQEAELSAFTAKQREAALQRRACVERFRDAMQRRPGLVKDWLPGLLAELERDFPALGVKRATLYAWHKRYLRPADLVKLIDQRGGDRKSSGDPAAWKAFKDLFLHENGPSIKQCWQAVGDIAKAEGWTWCTLKSCHGQLDSRIDPDTQLLHRNPALYRQRLMPFIEQQSEAWKAGECWIGDHHQLNLWCSFNGLVIRPWLTAWMDWRTRRIAGWVLSDSPNSTTILAAIRHGLLDERNLGGPGFVWIDNGKDYDAWVFHGQTKKERLAKIKPAVDEPTVRGIFSMLQIEPHFSLAYNPNGKARLERWFGTLEGFYRTWETYCGNAPGKAPERLAEYVLGKPGLIPGFKDVYERLKLHIEGDNASAEHEMEDLAAGGRRLSPDAALALWCKTKRIMADPKALDLLMLHWQKPTTVGRNGISLSIMGQTFRYGQFSPELRPFKGLHKQDRRPVHVAFDPHDLGSVRVFDEGFRFVCEAKMNQQGGLHDGEAVGIEAVKQLSREKAKYAKATKHKAELGITSVLTNEERLAEIAAQQAAPAAVAQPDALKIIRTPVDGQAKAIERSEFRTAVGDGTPLPSVRSAFDLLAENRRQEAAASVAAREEDGFASDPWAMFRGQGNERRE